MRYAYHSNQSLDFQSTLVASGTTNPGDLKSPKDATRQSAASLVRDMATHSVLGRVDKGDDEVGEDGGANEHINEGMREVGL